MNAIRSIALALSVGALVAAVRADTVGTDLPQRQELKRADLAISPGDV